MFRLAATRASRAYTPGLIRCRRLKSDMSIPAASTSEVKKARTAKTPKTFNVQSTQEGVKMLGEEVQQALKDFDKGVLSAVRKTTSSKHVSTGEETKSRFTPQELPLPADYDPRTEEEYHATLVHGRSVHPPYRHPQTHGIPVAMIHFRSHYPKLLQLFTHFALHAASYLGIPTSGVVSLPTQRSLWTVLRSPFAHKKSQENFERRVHKRAIKAYDADPKVVDRWLQYLRKRRMGGIGMRFVTWDHVEVGVGRSRLQHVQMQNEAPGSEKIRKLAEQIAQEQQTTHSETSKEAN